ncbi:MAG: hypothetical protein KHZ77_00015 [Veillonella sp.]|uniref:sodium/glutamate symporter n=1 Tax=Veillonella sp. TaxID=1926307 RepID=UPI0025ECB111|nr:sodium/glutamate symporter [Veillonella sp.]MBS4912538.1 hypothetical protein [Veillonella sp.]
MTSKMMADMLFALGVLSMFLLLGTFIRAKVRVLQQTFIPASVIGGFILLIFGPVGLNWIPLPADWIKFYSLIPGILIVPVVASVPLGLKITSSGKTLKNVMPLALIGSAIGMLQFTLGFVTQVLFDGSYDFYPTFGWELGLGYVGGHGTAGLLGNMLQGMNLPFWHVAQGVAITTATFGLVGGIILGMILINIAARRGQTSILKKPGDIPESFKVGYIKDVSKQPSMGRETTMSSSIDAYAFHCAIIFGVCAVSYWLLAVIKGAKVPVLKDISIWAYCIIVMFIVWWAILKLKIDYLVDGKVKSKISGSLTEFAVVAAIGSMPIKAVMTYFVPILFMCLLGYVLTIGFLWFTCKAWLKDYWFEHMIATMGMSTGVFLTGILLLRICDPDFESPVLANYSLSYTLTSVAYFAILNVFLSTLLYSGIQNAIWLSLGLGVAETIAAFVISRLLMGKVHNA